MNIDYKSTRDDQVKVTASQAILQGISNEGGLFVPQTIPDLDIDLDELPKMTYQEVAFRVMKPYLADYRDDELWECINKAYDDKFACKEIAPLKILQQKGMDKVSYLELFHGATLAFKDMALAILPHLMGVAVRKNRLEEDIVILTATSGDTGKAALAGFADVPGVKIIVFYPKDGVSQVQELQMVTQTGANTHVVGVRGNFDDTQTGVKQIFANQAIKEQLKQKGYVFSSANSINIGRLVPQIVYYYYAYGRLLAANVIKSGEAVDVAVPTGNFGNILAAYYAKQTGLPLAKLICASNENKVLYDFFTTGTYNRDRNLVTTTSPSMDILISSNLERFIYHISGKSADKCRELMLSLTESKKYTISPMMREKMADFHGDFASEADTAAAIKHVFDRTGYLIDPHTAVAAHVYEAYQSQFGLSGTPDDGRKTIITAAASPYKFAGDVLRALGADGAGDVETTTRRLSEISQTPIPAAISALTHAPIRHHTVCDIDEMTKMVTDFLK